MNWETFDWGSWWFGFTVAIWFAAAIRELGEHVRNGRKPR